MQRATAFVLIILLLSGLASDLIQFVQFKISQAYIIENLCEERSLAENNCQGSCQLKKQLNKSSTEAEDRSIPYLSWISLRLNFIANESRRQEAAFADAQLNQPRAKNDKISSQLLMFDIFAPPKFLEYI
jgi:hypothetical protein